MAQVSGRIRVKDDWMPMKRVLGLGVACVDIIACVNEYPKPDEKIRADSVQLFSGGNVGNTLTAISKLGEAEASILTKVGKDSNGAFYVDDLKKVGVDVTNVIDTLTAPTLLVYVIVDKQGCRTCIASPNEEELTPLEIVNRLRVTNETTGAREDGTLLDNIQLVHLDSRHTTAAIVLAKEANLRNITVSLDVEKDRLFLSELMPLCDILFTNQSFPETYYMNKMNDSGAYDGQILFRYEEGSNGDSMSQENFGDANLLSALMSMTFLFYTDSTTESSQGTHPTLNGNSDLNAILRSPAPANISTVVSTVSRAELVVTTRGSLGSLLMRRTVKEQYGEDGQKVGGRQRGSFMASGENPMRRRKQSAEIVLSEHPDSDKVSLMTMSENPMDRENLNRDRDRDIERKNSVRTRGSFVIGENPMETTEAFTDPLMIQKMGSGFEHENPMETTEGIEDTSTSLSSSMGKIKMNKDITDKSDFDEINPIDRNKLQFQLSAQVQVAAALLSRQGGDFKGQNLIGRIDDKCDGNKIVSEENLDQILDGKRSSLTIKNKMSGNECNRPCNDNSENSINHSLLAEVPLKIDKFVFSRLLGTKNRTERVEFEVIQCAAWPVRTVDLVDSTGAGDAYIGGFITGLSAEYSDEICMKLGTSVAAAKLLKKGARKGLPTAPELNLRLQALIDSHKMKNGI